MGWTLSEDVLIDEIDDRANHCTEASHRRLAVVILGRAGCKYLRTDPTRRR
ncbi:MAG: hypothetical protein WB507_09165 [Solirubrobacterales bacterium]